MAERPSVFMPVDAQAQQGPFAGFLRPPEPTPGQGGPPQVQGPVGTMGGLATVASSFIEGATKARIKAFEERENAKQRRSQALSGFVSQIHADPNLTDDAKQFASQQYYRAIGADIQDATKDAPKPGKNQPQGVKDHFTNILKDVATGLTGGKAPKGGADVGNTMADIREYIYGSGDKPKPEFYKPGLIEGSLAKMRTAIDAMPPGDRDQESVVRAVSSELPNLRKYAGAEADRHLSDLVHGYRPALTPGSQPWLMQEFNKANAPQGQAAPAAQPQPAAPQQGAPPPGPETAAPVPTPQGAPPPGPIAQVQPTVSDLPVNRTAVSPDGRMMEWANTSGSGAPPPGPAVPGQPQAAAQAPGKTVMNSQLFGIAQGVKDWVSTPFNIEYPGAEGKPVTVMVREINAPGGWSGFFIPGKDGSQVKLDVDPAKVRRVGTAQPRDPFIIMGTATATRDITLPNGDTIKKGQLYNYHKAATEGSPEVIDNLARQPVPRVQGASESAAMLRYKDERHILDALNKVYRQTLSSGGLNEGGMPGGKPLEGAALIRAVGTAARKYYGDDTDVNKWLPKIQEWVNEEARKASLKGDWTQMFSSIAKRNEDNMNHATTQHQAQTIQDRIGALDADVKDAVSDLLGTGGGTAQKQGGTPYNEIEKE